MHKFTNLQIGNAFFFSTLLCKKKKITSNTNTDTNAETHILILLLFFFSLIHYKDISCA